MKKTLTLILIAIVLVILIIGGVLFVQKQKQKRLTAMPSSQIILFYSDQCPHCARVERFLEKHQVDQSLSIVKLDIRRDQSSIPLLLDRAKRCHITITNTVDIPFLWTGSKCVTGGPAVIDFFKHKLDIKTE